MYTCKQNLCKLKNSKFRSQSLTFYYKSIVNREIFILPLLARNNYLIYIYNLFKTACARPTSSDAILANQQDKLGMFLHTLYK